MGKIRCSHTNLNSWPRKEITVSKNKYTSQFISVIQESTSMPKKIGEKKLKSSHPNQGVGLLGPRGLRVMLTGSKGVKGQATGSQ